MQILHLEYSAFFRKIVHDMLSAAGYNPISTSCGSELYKILAMEDVDVIITGLELSDMTGEELIEDLRASKFGNLPVVVVSGSDKAEIRERLKGIFVDDYILKSQLDQERLIDCVERLVH